MRRNDREITDRGAIDRILEEASVCHLALCDGDRPYVVPLCFGYDGRRLYFHCASEGRKIDLIRRNPNACFAVESGFEVTPRETACRWGAHFRSVLGAGRLSIVADPEEKRRGLAALMAHYGGPSADWTDDAVRSVCVLRLDIDELSGKTA